MGNATIIKASRAEYETKDIKELLLLMLEKQDEIIELLEELDED